MKKFLAIFFTLTPLFLLAQNLPTIKLNPQITVADIKTIKLYRLNPKNPCNSEKTTNILNNRSTSTCFDYVSSFTGNDAIKIISLFRSKNSYYKAGFSDCFNTNYGLLFFGKNDVIIDYINISFDCTNIYSNSLIPEAKYCSPDNLSLVAFTKDAQKHLLKLLKISPRIIKRNKW